VRLLQVLSNVGTQWLVVAVTILASYILVPFTLHALGTAGYGTWILIGALTGYLNLLALGVPMASVRYMALHAADRNQPELNRVLSVCASWYLSISGIALVIGAVLLTSVRRCFNVPPELLAQARIALTLSVLSVVVGFVQILPYSVMAAHHDFARRNAVTICGVLLRLGLTVSLLSIKPSLVYLGVAQVSVVTFEAVVLLLLVKRRYPGTKVHFKDFDWSKARRLLAFSFFVTLLSGGHRLVFHTDALVIARYLPADQIAYYAIANNFVLYLIELILGIGSVVMPMAVKLQIQGQQAELREFCLKWSKIALSVTLITGLFLIVLGGRFLKWWMGPSFEGASGRILQILVISSLVYLPAASVPQAILMGLGKGAWPGAGFLLTGVVNVGLSVLLTRPLGLVGIAMGTAIPNVLYASAITVLACRQLGIPLSEYLHYVYIRAVVGSVPPLIVLFWFKTSLDVQDLRGLGLAGVCMVMVFLVVWMTFVYRKDPLFQFQGRLLDLIRSLNRSLRAFRIGGTR